MMPAKPQIETPWYTLAEAAAYAKRHTNTLQLALADGRLRGYQTTKGGVWQIHRDDLDAWIRGEVAEVQVPRVTRPARSA